jgi:hypothetical protein
MASWHRNIEGLVEPWAVGWLRAARVAGPALILSSLVPFLVLLGLD